MILRFIKFWFAFYAVAAALVLLSLLLDGLAAKFN